MRYAILADVHGNYDALEAVLEDAEEGGADAYICLGDIVGYGAEPDLCVDAIRGLRGAVVAGNHDFAAVDKTSIEYFNNDARDAVLWTRTAISDEQRDYLAGLEMTAVVDGLTLVHSTLHAPEMFNYVLNPYDAELCLQHLTTQLCFLGHSHSPIIFLETNRIEPVFDTSFEIEPGQRALINVGSVGQPRDQNPHAAYGLYDTQTRRFELRRAAYDVDSAVRKILDAGLPGANALRLRLGR